MTVMRVMAEGKALPVMNQSRPRRQAAMHTRVRPLAPVYPNRLNPHLISPLSCFLTVASSSSSAQRSQHSNELFSLYVTTLQEISTRTRLTPVNRPATARRPSRRPTQRVLGARKGQGQEAMVYSVRSPRSCGPMLTIAWLTLPAAPFLLRCESLDLEPRSHTQRRLGSLRQLLPGRRVQL